eukprot:Nk52_evm58s2192 gene=Nk52_evmTU58s2192
MISDDDVFEMEEDDWMPEKASKKASKPLKSKASSKNVLKESGAQHNVKKAAASGASKSDKGKAVEDIYQKKTQLEHILLRPDTYIGSVEEISQQLWVCDSDGTFKETDVSFVPGLYKIFDEILVNAADNKARDPTMNAIKIDIDTENCSISVWNNGKGIPVVMHSVENVYVPELIFGHLLTSSNYNDNEKKVTGGRNGYGAKLCNIFSKEFIVETSDSSSGQKFKQVFSNNMSVIGKPKITKSKDDYTCITFTPDLEKFGMTQLDSGFIGLLRRRAYDVAGCLRGVKVFLNGEKLPVRSFSDYVGLYLKNREELAPVVHEVVNERWEICVTPSEHGQFQQVSFVNNIATTKGGTHVSYVTDQMVASLIKAVNKKTKATLKPFQIKNHLWVFINCLIENPSFDSQTKENMTLRAKAFGSECSLSDKFVKAVLNTGVVENILNWVKIKQESQLSKKCSGSKRTRLCGIPKLDDANDAGGRNSTSCTLILTEGDSAKALAVSGLGVVGRDKYGVFPLRGKLLNVREATHKQIMENAEIQNIVKILGLQFKKNYEDSKSLRYGSLMIMTDQDHDGSHIKGLLINFIHHFWPSLLKVPGFLVEFITPIVKCTKGNNSVSFYTLPEYEHWKENTPQKGWKIKYYKGLGTSTMKEAKEYFSDMSRHKLAFEYTGNENEMDIDLAFSKKKADDRKEWLRTCDANLFLDQNTESISYSDFINKELILFSMADNIRSIPSMVDGFKPGQRKVLFSCFKRNLKEEIKVAQLAGYVSEHSAYHHGEVSLCGTIINLAQDYVGSNNVNFLVPAGQFGTRLQGGKDAASPRYIFTKLSSITKNVFDTRDADLLKYLDDDGQSIEPEWFMPILPSVLVNGSDGIGTGWSTYVPNFNPRDIVANLKRLMNGEPAEVMHPWYKGYDGFIEFVAENKYLVHGKYEKIDETTLRITELPLRSWTQNYKEFLESMVTGTDKVPAFIKDYKEHHTDTTVDFTVILTEEKMREAESIGIEKKFKLVSQLSLTNMVLFDHENRIRKYDNANELLEEFYRLRLSFYRKRKSHLADCLTEEWSRLDNKVRFILSIINGELVISNRKKDALLAELKEKKYAQFPQKSKSTNSPGEEDDLHSGIATGGYDYLLSMPMWNLTLEKVEKLKKERDEKERELSELLDKSPEDLWHADLDDFIENLEELDEKEKAEKDKDIAMARAKKAKGGKRMTKKIKDEDDDNYVPTTKKKSSAASSSGKNVKVEAPAKPKPTAGRASKKAAEIKLEVMEDSDTEDKIDVKPAKQVAVKASKASPQRQASAVAKSTAYCSDSEGEEVLTLAQRIAQKMQLSNNKHCRSPSMMEVSSPSVVPKSKKVRTQDKSKIQSAVSNIYDEFSEPEAAKAKPTAKPKKVVKGKRTAPAKAPAKKKVESSEDDFCFSDPDEVVPTTSRTSKPRRAAAVAKKTVVEISSSEEEEDDSGSDFLPDY